MSCDSKFSISKGLPNTFVFTIKGEGTTLPMTIQAGDTFTAHLIDPNPNPTDPSEPLDPLALPSIVLTKALNVVDATNGKVSLVISAAETNTLKSKRGSEVDRYYTRPTYRLVIEASTQQNGDFIVKVPEVYVE